MIKFPDSFKGRDGKADYDAIVNAPEKTIPIIQPIVQPTGDLSNFIYIPSIKLYVAKERTHLNKNWFDCHKELQKEGNKMLIIPEFIEFINFQLLFQGVL